MSDFDLDRPDTYQDRDPDDMYGRVNDLAAQIESAWVLAEDVRLPHRYRDAANVIIAGMGGSAIGGSLLESYGQGTIPVPVAVWRGYDLPAYVDGRSLVIAVSYSGNTEETLSALKAAHDRGAMLACVTTGGAIGNLTRDWGVPTVRFAYPAQPRATLGYLFTPLLSLFSQLGFLPPQGEAVREAVEAARAATQSWGAESPTAGNAAKQLARRCVGRVVIAYGAEYLGGVARRWKTQLNENAKNWGFFEEFSELDHNAIVGYEHPSAFNDIAHVLVLTGSHLSERIQTRMEVTAGLMTRYGVSHETVLPPAGGILAEMISTIALGDYMTYYLALLNGADPTVIEPIDHLKAALATR